ncbi:MAG: FAD-binding oxidoreductase [Actinomycetia bacterium]|nr:FAD-binding oxidoreductase [Actinomycetes bacterium]
MKSLAQYFGRWGVPLEPVEVNEATEAYISAEIGEATTPSQIAPLADLLPEDSSLSAQDQEAIAAVVGPGHLSVDAGDRLTHTVGCSLTDYLRLRDQGAKTGPQAIVRPTSTSQIAELLAVCSRRGINVVPYGGGTSVVGGLEHLDTENRPSIAVALEDMAEILKVNEVDSTVTVQPGVTGPTLERYLGARGFTLGHLPQSWERATIGGYVATRSAGQASSGFGRSDEMVEALTVATPQGVISLGRAPKSAAGPDLRQLFIGSEGVFGIVSEVTLRIRRAVEHAKYEGLMFPSFAAGQEAFREIVQAGFRADVMRLSDETETTTNLKMSAPGGRAGDLFQRYLRVRNVSGGALAILGWHSHSSRLLSARRSAAWDIVRRHGGVTLGSGVGSAWKRHRFAGPYLRDVLLDRGYIVETLETATHYSNIAALKSAVTEALTASLTTATTSVHVMCHISHVYETGCSLYFTVIAAADADPIAQWWAAKRAASDAIVASAATISHHHAVGRDHAPWLTAEIGAEGVAVLQAVKDIVDPEGIMNPGKLIPDSQGTP